jgi:TonB family protein
MFRRFWLLVLLVLPPTIAATAKVPGVVAPSRTATLDQKERRVWRILVRNSEFTDVPHTSARSRCEDVQPPEALTTPTPLWTPSHDSKVKVSFIVGTDGRVHSPLILESAGATGDRRVLQTVRAWRYRPATCNGVPTETEGKIEFSSR